MFIFQFKHFTIQQEHAALKVGTDAMLLGSLCNWESPTRLLDIGTGTGVLALMCAQRFAFDEIVGLELDKSAVKDAKLNAGNSPFQSPIQIVHQSLQEYETDQQFDAIISNPPFFENSSKNENEQLGLARHTDSLSYSDLISNIARLLSQEGKAWIILPNSAEEAIINLAVSSNLSVDQIIRLEGKPGRHVRTIFCLRHFSVTASRLPLDDLRLPLDDLRLPLDDLRLTLDDLRLTLDDLQLSLDDLGLPLDDLGLPLDDDLNSRSSKPVEIKETCYSTFTIRDIDGNYSEEYKALTKEFHDREL